LSRQALKPKQAEMLRTTELRIKMNCRWSSKSVGTEGVVFSGSTVTKK
jgi:hypothetical protein